MSALAGTLAALLIRALGRTLRLRIEGGDRLAAVRGGPFLFLVWHGRILLPIHRHRDERVIGMVSLSKDGDLTARILAGLGYDTVRGSSSRGGKQAFHTMLDGLAKGRPGAVIPDGPRGPARELKPGSLYLAQQAGVKLLPLGASARPALRLKSWDRFLIPRPFARAALVYGEPVEVPRDASTERIEQIRQELERRLNELEAEADRLVVAAR